MWEELAKHADTLVILFVLYRISRRLDDIWDHVLTSAINIDTLTGDDD
jgi:hypothetical protein